MNNRQHRFVKKKPHQANIISFYDRIMAFGDRGKTVAVIWLYLSKLDFYVMWNSLKQGRNNRKLQKLLENGIQKKILIIIREMHAFSDIPQGNIPDMALLNIFKERNDGKQVC